MLINEDVKTCVSTNTVKYYREKGYCCSVGDVIFVKVIDLMPNSNVKIRYVCDKCGDIVTISLCDYTKKHKDGNDFCKKCKYEKTKKTNKKKYGCDNVMQNDEIKKRVELTNIQRYGVPCVFSCEEIKNKIRDSINEKYGCDYPIQNKEIMIKTEKTNMERYGCKYPIVRFYDIEKVKDTNIKRYGCEYSIASKDVRKKIRESFYKNGSVKTSSQQKYICDLYGAKLNYPFDICNVDMYFEKEKIYCEYDGGGHNISIYYGKKYEDFIKKEIKRSYYLKSLGLKEFRIISRHDFIPSDDVLIKMKDFAFHKLLDEGYSWIKFDIDNKIVIYKDCQELYNFE